MFNKDGKKAAVYLQQVCPVGFRQVRVNAFAAPSRRVDGTSSNFVIINRKILSFSSVYAGL